MLGIPQEDTSFDVDVIGQINSAFMSLNLLGIGVDGFYVADSETIWSEFMSENLDKFGGLDTYIYTKVKLGFDPPTTSFTIEAMTKMIEELEYKFRLQQQIIEAAEAEV
jgi:hypothetical protein